MRGWRSTASVVLCVAGIGAARAESGSFFKNMLGGGGDSKSALDDTPGIGAPKLYDPNGTYCPTISVREGASAVQASAGSAGDSGRLRHQIMFARLSRECGARPDGAVVVKVGVELRALLGPAGSPGTFEAPVTISLKFLDSTLDSRTRSVRVTVPAGAAQGTAAVIEDGLIVPAAQAMDYDIEVALAGAARPKAPKVATKRGRKPASVEAAAGGGAPEAGQ